MNANNSSKIKPYTPVQYSHLECRLFNLISSKIICFEMGFGQQTVSVNMGFDHTIFPYQGINADHNIDLAFEAASELWQISFLKTHHLYELMELADSSGFFVDTPPESLPDDVFWPVFEAFLAESLGKAEASLGSSIKIAAPVSQPVFDYFTTRFELAFVDKNGVNKRVHGFLSFPFKEACVSLLEQKCSGFSKRYHDKEMFFQLGKKIFFQAGNLLLKMQELSTLEVGDVLVPDRWYPKNNMLAICIKPHLFFCDYDEQTQSITIRAKNGTSMDESVENISIKDQTDILGKDNMVQENITSAEPKGGVIDTDSLDMNLVFEVSQATMTVEQIGQLTTGQVIALPHKLDAGVPVNIKVNNQLIAKGKIVGIGDDIGVQITNAGTE